MSSNQHDPDCQFWRDFGLHGAIRNHSGTIATLLPEGFVALRATALQLGRGLASLNTPYDLQYNVADDDEIVVYQRPPEVSFETLQEVFGANVEILRPGDLLPLPFGERLKDADVGVDHITKLSAIPLLDVERFEEAPQLEPLSRYSLRGQGSGLEAEVQKALALLGWVILAGQATVIYAAPNTGKTLLLLHLLIKAVLAGRLNPHRVFYVNADDSGAGAVEKLVLLDDAEVHTLIPGFNGFRTADLIQALNEIIAADDCSGVVIIIDTLKKFVDLMDKKVSATFGNFMRQFVMKGGTVVALAHTRKNPSVTGKAVYGGTSDIVEDFDAACLLVPIIEDDRAGERTVQFQFFKRRGPNVDQSYAYAHAPALSYSERLASVRLVSDEEVEAFASEGERQSDQPVIDAITACMTSGVDQKMKLVEAASARSGASRRTVMQVLERYSGDDPSEHLWTYSVQERGAKVFRLHAG
jgi:predicted lactoylglutathione lyase